MTEAVPWVPQLGVDLDLRLDGFAVLFAALVAGIGVLVVAYSLALPAAGRRRPGPAARPARRCSPARCWALVLADDLIVLFGFWELTSITSFLLIGNDHTSAKARAAALQALLSPARAAWRCWRGSC